MQSVEIKPTALNSAKVHRLAGEAREAVVPASKPSRKISRETLINRLNYLHFQSVTLTVLLTHRQNGRDLRLTASPQACVDDNFTCAWTAPLPAAVARGDFELRHLEIPHGQHILQVEVQQPKLTAEELQCLLPDVCRELIARRVRRHFCHDIEVNVTQNGAIFFGSLEDFSAAAFRLTLEAKPPQTFQWLKVDEPLTVNFSSAGQALLSTTGLLLRSQGQRDRQTLVVAPTLAQQRRFPPKKHRTRRLELRPAPEAIFTHPITRQLIRLDVVDLSGAGMAVAEAPQEAQLLPGMVIDNLELSLVDSFTLSCQAQVVYCQSAEGSDAPPLQRCGLAILDMDVSDHTRLMALLHRAENRHKGISPKIDLDQLWEFFFACGFIYPKKYQLLQDSREQFRETYVKLYDNAPEIARHFIYQEQGRIVGHMAMLRQFSNSWLIHHHAADRTHSRTAGLDVLQLVGESVKESQALYSTHMDYVMCYFRPDNRFPQRIFGGAANHYDDPGNCSIDTFSYFHYRKEFDLKWKNGSDWDLTPASEDDLLDLESFYGKRSGGLMLRGMDLTAQHHDDKSLQESYRKAGFGRQQSLFALKHEERTLALFMVLKTEVGMNLSNLTNAITAIVMDSKALPREAFLTAISMLSAKYPQEEVPILTYPAEYTEGQSIETEKLYNLWVLNCRNLDPYYEFCNNFFKRLHRAKDELPS